MQNHANNMQTLIMSILTTTAIIDILITSGIYNWYYKDETKDGNINYLLLNDYT